MSDSNQGGVDRTLADVMYGPPTGGANAGVERARAFSDAGKVGAPAAGPTMRSTDGVISAVANALYPSGAQEPRPAGPSGMAGDHWRGTPTSELPLAADPAAHDLHARQRSAPADQPAQAEPDPTAGADAETQQPTAAEQAMLAEFTNLSADLGLGEREQNELRQLHTKAISALYQQHEQTAAGWKKQRERAFSAQQLSNIRSRFNNALGNDKDAVEFKRLLAWSGIGNHPATIKAISRLLGRR